MRHVSRGDGCYDYVSCEDYAKIRFHPAMPDHHNALHLHGILVCVIYAIDIDILTQACTWSRRLSSLAFESVLFAFTLFRFSGIIHRDLTTGKHTFVYVFIRDGIWAFALIFGESALITTTFDL